MTRRIHCRNPPVWSGHRHALARVRLPYNTLSLTCHKVVLPIGGAVPQTLNASTHPADMLDAHAIFLEVGRRTLSTFQSLIASIAGECRCLAVMHAVVFSRARKNPETQGTRRRRQRPREGRVQSLLLPSLSAVVGGPVSMPSGDANTLGSSLGFTAVLPFKAGLSRKCPSWLP